MSVDLRNRNAHRLHPQLLPFRPLRKRIVWVMNDSHAAQFYEDRKADRDNLVIDSMYSGDIPLLANRCLLITRFKKSKVILGFNQLPESDKAYYCRLRRAGKSLRYFQDVPSPIPTHSQSRAADSSTQRSFAYDRVRLQNKERGIGIDYDGSAEHATIPFIPLPVDAGLGAVSRAELREQLIRQCEQQVDENPLDAQRWLRYLYVYEDAAYASEDRKERVGERSGDEA